jgi:hypothetical protein
MAGSRVTDTRKRMEVANTRKRSWTDHNAWICSVEGLNIGVTAQLL